MKNRNYSKSSFDKMYLIHQDMYNRILPHLSEIDKDDINELNSESNPQLNMAEDETKMEQNNREVEAAAKISSHTSDLNNTVQIDAGPAANAIPPSPLISAGDKHQTKPKKFSCPICIKKSFTTKRSMKRHYQTFHEQKQVLNNESNDIQKTKAEPDSNIHNNISLKRNFNDTGLEVEYDNDEPLSKQAKYMQQTGLKRKRQSETPDSELRKKFVPEISQKRRWSEARNLNDGGLEVEYDNDEPLSKQAKYMQQTGLKRKRQNETSDSQPRKKFHWSSY